MAAPEARIELLGGFDVACGLHRPELGSSSRRLLAMLALRRRPISRERLAGTLWPETSQDRAQGRLRTALWRLGAERNRLVSSSGDLVALGDGCEVDVHSAEDIGQALVTGDMCFEESQSGELLELFSQELLPDWDEPWVILDRELYREIRVHALETLAVACLEVGDHLRAIQASLQAIRCAPYRDSSHRLLVQAYRAEGNASAALRHILDYRHDVRKELGMTPERVLPDLVEELAG